MKKYILLFYGGLPKEGEENAVTEEWGRWIGDLGQEGKFDSGLPFGDGKVIKGPKNEVMDLDHSNPMHVSGYVIINAESLGEAVEIAKEAPLQKLGGCTEVRELAPIE